MKLTIQILSSISFIPIFCPAKMVLKLTFRLL